MSFEVQFIIEIAIKNKMYANLEKLNFKLQIKDYQFNLYIFLKH